MSRLTGLEHLDHEFATTWPTYDLDGKTRALLGYANKLTETPGFVEDADLDALRAAGWDERGGSFGLAYGWSSTRRPARQDALNL